MVLSDISAFHFLISFLQLSHFLTSVSVRGSTQLTNTLIARRPDYESDLPERLRKEPFNEIAGGTSHANLVRQLPKLYVQLSGPVRFQGNI
jgi:hypothetical protein